MVREILVNWVTAAGGNQVSVLNFEDAPTVEIQRAALDSALTSMGTVLAAGTSWSIATEGREFNPATGVLTGAWSDPLVFQGAGASGNAQAMADATQALIRWSTGVIANGRFVNGRTFIPGISRMASDGGNLGGPAQATLADAAQALIDAASGIGVWSRPTNDIGGAFFAATTATVWSEFAVQRRRRR